MPNAGGLERMVITAYENDSFTTKLPGAGNPMTVDMNPDQYSQTYTILYNDKQAQGSPGGSPEYNRTLADSLTFQLIFDGTGVVPSTLPGSASSTVATRIQQFLGLAFTYDGEIHSPNFLTISWGTLNFACRLSTLKVNYTLFLSDGTPLRAKVDATFAGYQNEKELAKEANAKSPDLSRVLQVKAGDTLPLMCYRVYGSSTYYLSVARVNGLAGFRELIPGTEILFPPLGSAK
ncbi:MAG: LysM peptidoglycan-binding domain-containing protein [Acidobacteriota bacterium]